MKASKLIEELENLMEENGDCYVVYRDIETSSEMLAVEEVEIIPYFETKYIYIK